jgi:hypothetical protein
MTKTMTIWDMMVAASLIAASGCGSVLAPGDDLAEGSGSGSGSGSETTPESPLTLEESDFVNDGLRLWTNTSGPALHGKYEGSNEAVVQVKVGAGSPVLATVDGRRWDVQLPSGAIQSTETLVTVTMTDPAQSVETIQVAMALDSAPPVLAIGGSSLRDERGDVISFNTNAAVHDHQGATVDLTAGCPIVYKYSYLMDTHAPLYNSELTPNPITYAVTVEDVRVAATEFRVRDAQGTVLRDWKIVAGSGAAFPVTLHRDGDAGIGDLATRAGKYTIDVRATDWAGLQANTSYCIDFQPLAAPLQFAQASTPTDADALATWKLQANSPISRLMNVGPGAAIAEQKITQYSSEPVVVSLNIPALTGSWRTHVLHGFIRSSAVTTRVSCNNYDCNTQPAAPTSFVWSGNLTSYTKSVQLLDAAGNVVAPTGTNVWLIPGRAAGAPPADYRVRVNVSQMMHFGSNLTYVYGDRTNQSLAYTGSASTQTMYACAHVNLANECDWIATYQHIRAVNTIGLNIDPFAIQVGVGASANTPTTAPVHVLPSVFTMPALTWDGGDENTL